MADDFLFGRGLHLHQTSFVLKDGACRSKEEVGLSLLPSALCRLPQGRSSGHYFINLYKKAFGVVNNHFSLFEELNFSHRIH